MNSAVDATTNTTMYTITTTMSARILDTSNTSNRIAATCAKSTTI